MAADPPLRMNFGELVADITNYLSVAPPDKVCVILKDNPSLIYDYINNVVEPMKIKIKLLEKDLAKLRNEIKYMPGGIGYHEAKQEFNSMANK